MLRDSHPRPESSVIAPSPGSDCGDKSLADYSLDFGSPINHDCFFPLQGLIDSGSCHFQSRKDSSLSPGRGKLLTGGQLVPEAPSLPGSGEKPEPPPGSPGWLLPRPLPLNRTLTSGSGRSDSPGRPRGATVPFPRTPVPSSFPPASLLRWRGTLENLVPQPGRLRQACRGAAWPPAPHVHHSGQGNAARSGAPVPGWAGGLGQTRGQRRLARPPASAKRSGVSLSLAHRQSTEVRSEAPGQPVMDAGCEPAGNLGYFKPLRFGSYF